MLTGLKYLAGIFVVTALIVLGGWKAGWWFAEQNATHQGQVIRNSYNNQQTLRENITTAIATVNTDTTNITFAVSPSQTSALDAQRDSDVSTVCGYADQIVGDPLPLDQQKFVADNCLNGSINPASPLYK